MVTWIAKTALTRIRTTVVSTDALAPARMSPVSALQEKGQWMGQERGQCPHWAWCTLVSLHFLRGATVPHVGRGCVILLTYYYYLLIFGCMLLYVLLCSWRSVEDASVRLYFSAVSVFVAAAHPLCTVAVTWFTQALLVGWCQFRTVMCPKDCLCPWKWRLSFPLRDYFPGCIPPYGSAGLQVLIHFHDSCFQILFPSDYTKRISISNILDVSLSLPWFYLLTWVSGNLSSTI